MLLASCASFSSDEARVIHQRTAWPGEPERDIIIFLDFKPALPDDFVIELPGPRRPVYLVTGNAIKGAYTEAVGALYMSTIRAKYFDYLISADLSLLDLRLELARKDAAYEGRLIYRHPMAVFNERLKRLEVFTLEAEHVFSAPADERYPAELGAAVQELIKKAEADLYAKLKESKKIKVPASKKR